MYMGICELESRNSYRDAVKVSFSIKWDLVSFYVNITPIFCNNCDSALQDLYQLLGSRYGQVGEVKCKRCSSTICVTDNDYRVEELYNSVESYRNPWTNNLKEFDKKVSHYKFIYKDLFLLDTKYFKELLKLHSDSIMLKSDNFFDLSDVIEDFCIKLNIKVADIPQKELFRDRRITVLPKVIIIWYNFLLMLGIVKENNGQLSKKTYPLDKSLLQDQL